ncbi:hypothetical protein SAMN05421734_101430 [Pelagirhabdus alkalitolerans]|uniref:Uncharacterized protein n=1 Tax=Pelagirhabdus alkalitolerans TaxID=1612202 RepID=A0A1G6GRB0_9BACI|nr:hypothetical protein SAMN05421734_101430 [Pelagirhabdus alkalitolerans]
MEFNIFIIIISIIAIYGPIIIIPVCSVILVSNILHIVSYKIHIPDKQKAKIIISTTLILLVFSSLLSTIASN